jgi:hypothetical protein
MFRRIQGRVTFANVVSLLALFVALGGTAWAAALITSKQIKNRTIRKIDVKKNTLSGVEIKESTLGLVPQAGHANSATSANRANTATSANTANTASSAGNANSADSAKNADKVDGLDAAGIDFRATGETNPATILDLGGLKLTASCDTGNDLTLTAENTGAQGHLQAEGDAAGEPATFAAHDDDSYTNGETTNLLIELGSQFAGTIVYSNQSGSHVTANLQWDDITGGASSIAGCFVGGTAMHTG